jgi:hypothetical protein
MADHAYIFSPNVPKDPEDLHSLVSGALRHPRFFDALRAHLVTENDRTVVAVLPKSIQDTRVESPIRLTLWLGEAAMMPNDAGGEVQSNDRFPCIETEHSYEGHLPWHLDYLLSMCLIQKMGGGQLQDDGTGPMPVVAPEAIKAPYAQSTPGFLGILAGMFRRKSDQKFLVDYAEFKPFFRAENPVVVSPEI